MNYQELLKIIKQESENTDTFNDSSEKIQRLIFSLDKKSFIPILSEIGIIPESILHDSSEEKLFAKVADIALAKAFHEIGLNAEVNQQRSNCADVIGRSKTYNYSLVGDAKAFRLSRTAKNQKDFKVKSMIDWRGQHDFSVLVAPYFQYPRLRSQVYGQALDGRICLLSWEHLVFLLKEEICESNDLDLSFIWSISLVISNEIMHNEKDRCFLSRQNQLICKYTKTMIDSLNRELENSKKTIINRGEKEISFWNDRIREIKHYSHEAAIIELISALKVNEKIDTIKKYIDYLRGK
ncbi:MAG: HindIII family type II restriction endonuclease [Brevinematales bacterium]|nr:HindIII family type II restriction endonuclease [Brevinematales bacterium]